LAVLAVPYFPVVGAQSRGWKSKKPSEMIMKTLVSALLALSFVAGVVAPASAADEPFSIKQLDKEGRGGQANG
jgi:hypothetical protein